MNNKAPDAGGGKYNTYDLDIHQIDEASRTDFAKVSEMETRRDGWKAYRDLMADMKADLDAEMPKLMDNFDSPAGRVFVEALTMMSNEIANHRELADNNRESSDSVIAEVKRVRPLIEDIMTDRKLAVESRNELQSQPQDGSDAYSHALEDTLAEARRTFSESNSVYSSNHAKLTPPPEYKGPVYAGPDPKTPLEDNYQHAYYPDDTPYRDGTYTGAGGEAPGAGGSSGSESSPVGSRPDGSEGPELQNPGGAPPTSTNPPPVTNAPGPNPGQGSLPPAYVPGGGQPVGPIGSKPVTPLAAKPVTGPMNGAKPTPGMTRPMTSGSGMGPRSTVPVSGRPGTNAAPKNSLLPNQRQVAAGRTPVTGSGRMPSGTGPGAGPRGVTSAGSARPGSVPSGAGRGGLVRKPNAGFEESLYRNTRAGRTVPGVIGSRGAEGNAPNGRAAGASSARVAAAGKVIGGRKNKGPRDGKPKLQSGSLTDTTAKSKKDTRHTWQRMPVEQSTQPPTGAVAISRNAPKRPQTADEIAEAKLQARKRWRRKFYASKQEPKLEPASELFGGTEGKVTRGVIRGAGVSQPVDRKDAGTRFSTYGWEDDA